MNRHSFVTYLNHCLAETRQSDTNFLYIRCKEGQTGKSGRTYCEAFACRSRGVTERVESICAAAHFFTQTTHFGISTGIVGNGAISISGKGYAESRKHSDSSNADSIKTHRHISEIKARSEPITENYTGNDGNNRNRGRDHTQADTGYYNSSRTSRSALGKLLSRLIRL